MMNEQQLEDLCIGWFQELGWQFVHGPDIAPEGLRPERFDYRQVILRDRPRLHHGLLRRQAAAAARDEEPHVGGSDRPQRSGRPVVCHLLRGQ